MLPKQAANPQKPGSTALMMSRAVLPVRNAHPAAPSMVFRLFHDLYHIQIVTGAFVPYEVVVPTVEPGSIVVMPPDTGNMISFIRFRLGTKSQPIVQTSDRKFQIVLDVPAAV